MQRGKKAGFETFHARLRPAALHPHDNFGGSSSTWVVSEYVTCKISLFSFSFSVLSSLASPRVQVKVVGLYNVP